MAALRYFFYLLMKPATLIMAFLGATGVLAPYTDPHVWWIPAFSGLFLPVILMINFFLLIFWIFYKKLWVVLPLAAILVNYNFISSMYQNPWKKIQVPSQGKRLTIASYNVESFYWISKAPEKRSLKKMVEDHQIDILCLQEHCDPKGISEDSAINLTGLPYRAVFFNHKTSWANFGLSVYSKYPIIAQGEIDFQSIRNSALWVDIKVQEDTLRVFNNHLQTTDLSLNKQEYYKQKSIRNWSGQARVLVRILDNLKVNFLKRAQQSMQIRNIMDTTHYPILLCGDFNDTPISFSLHHLLQAQLTDGFRECGKGYGHTFRGLKRLFRIDFVAYGPQFKGLSYVSPEQDWSDHNPIIMHLNYTPS